MYSFGSMRSSVACDFSNRSKRGGNPLGKQAAAAEERLDFCPTTARSEHRQCAQQRERSGFGHERAKHGLRRRWQRQPEVERQSSEVRRVHVAVVVEIALRPDLAAVVLAEVAGDGVE